MKRTLCILIVLSAFIFGSVIDSLSSTDQKRSKKNKQEDVEVIIPAEIKDLMEQGLADQQPELDFPFEISRHYYLPAQENVHFVCIIKINNSVIDFFPVESKPEKGKTEQDSETEENQAVQGCFKVFAGIYERENDNIGKLIRESYAPFVFQGERSSLQTEDEHIYSIGLPLPPGDYLAALAVTSPDLSKTGIQFYKFSLPDARSFRKKLGITPIILIKSIKNLEQPEIITRVHKDSFVYSTLEIYPKTQNTFSPGEAMDLMYFVFGCKPQEGTNQFKIKADYQIKQNKETVIKYKEQTLDFPLISHPLPLLKENDKPLEPGLYNLIISLTDTVTNNSITHYIEFEVKK